MRTIYLFIYLFFLVLRRNFLKTNYIKIKNNQGEKEAQQYLHGIAMKWARDFLNKAGVKVISEGNENIPSEACCFVANHQGNFDIFALLSVVDRPIGFIAKKEINKLPIVPWWMNEMKCVFIDRENIRESLKAINQGAENLKNGNSMVIFPEGTRSKSSELGEFKKGSLKMASKANVPIVPVALEGSYKILEENNGRLEKGTIKVVFGKPIYIDQISKEEQKELAELVRNEIANKLKEV